MAETPTQSNERISVRTSLDGVKELYLIIVGIGITEALVHPRSLASLGDGLAYALLLAGYLVTIFRFSLGIINMLGHVAEKVHQKWSELMSVVCMCFIACALSFFWMGINLDQMWLFLVATLLLLLSHWAMLFVSHKPWLFPRGWGLWIIGKGMAICLGYPFGIYDPKSDKQRYWPLSEEQALIKSTHYQWIRSDFWLGMLCIVLLCNLHYGWWGVFQEISPSTAPDPDFQLLMGAVLLLFGIWDFHRNRAYYFGHDEATGSGLNF